MLLIVAARCVACRHVDTKLTLIRSSRIDPPGSPGRKAFVAAAVKARYGDRD
jgi:hypothetical protein